MDSRSVSPSSLTTVMLDFLPNGGLVSTTSTVTFGSFRSASSPPWIGGVLAPVVGTDAVQKQVHRAQTGNAVHKLDATERVVSQMLLLRAVELVVRFEVVVRRKEESAGAASRIRDDLARPRAHAVHDGVDEGPRREVLASAAFDVLRVALEQPLVGVALHVRGHLEPRLVADEIDDEPTELRRVLNLVLRLAEDQAEHAALLAELLERIPVVLLELDAFHLRPCQVVPAKPLGDRLLLALERRALVRHLEKQQERQLLQVVLIAEAVVSQDLAVTPELLDDAVAEVTHGKYG